MAADGDAGGLAPVRADGAGHARRAVAPVRTRASDDGGPAYGVALLSRLPVLRFGCCSCRPHRCGRRRDARARSARVVLLEDEPRAAIIAVVEYRAGYG